MRFIQAQNFSPGSPFRKVRLIVLHSMENREKPTAAEDVALWFAGLAKSRTGDLVPAPRSSAHVCVDSDSAVQCLRLHDVAWAAPGANRDGLHIEHAGWANQTLEDWKDTFSSLMLGISARVCAEMAWAYQVPLLFIPAAGILAGESGITTHAEVTKAFKTPGGHTDPGGGFPMDLYLELVSQAMLLKDRLGPYGPMTP